MHIFILLLMMGLVVHDPSGMAPPPFLRGGWMAVAVFGPYLLLASIVWLAIRRTLRVVCNEAANPTRSLRRLDLLLALSRVALLVIFFADLYALGWLSWVREIVGDWIALDELLAAVPAFTVAVLEWWWYYPIDRRLREASAASAPTALGPPWPIGTRGQYMLSQVRHQVLLMLVPLVAVLVWLQVVARWVSPDPAWRVYEPPLIFGGFLVIFAFAPVMIRCAWDTAPLPEGELRDRLLAMCRSYRVRVRQLLLWRTYGGMINGAVMGVVGPLRFILLTDGLIARMGDAEIEAVMAHELGHIRRRHMPWLIVCAAATIYGLETLATEAAYTFERWSGLDLLSHGSRWEPAAAVAVLGLVVLAWLAVFGWVSRRFERQADTFAVQHLSRRYPDEGAPPGHVSAVAVHIYCEALRRVAALNHSPPDRRSWRHGSIRWRSDYLRRLTGTRLDRCGIDRTMRLICVGSAALLVGLAIYYDLLPWGSVDLTIDR